MTVPKISILCLLPSIALAGWPLESLPQGQDPALAIDDIGLTHIVSTQGDDLEYSVGSPGAWSHNVALSVPELETAAVATSPTTGDALLAVAAPSGLFINEPATNPGFAQSLASEPYLGVAAGHFGDGSGLVVAYRDSAPRGLVAFHQDALWTSQTLDPDPRGQHGASASVATAPDGNPRVGYLAATGADDAEVRVATWTGAAWQIDIVAPTLPDSPVAMALDSLGAPHLLYISTSGEAVIATHNGTAWVEEALPTASYDQPSLALAIDSQGVRHVVISGQLDPAGTCGTPFTETRYLVDDNGWTQETVATGYNDAASAIAIDPFDAPLVALSRHAGIGRTEVSQRLDAGLTVSITSTDISAVVGDTMAFDIDVHNGTSSPISFDEAYFLPRGSCDDLVARNGEVRIFNGSMTLAPGVTRSRTITRPVPRGAPWGPYQLEFGVRGAGTPLGLDVAYMDLQTHRDPVTLHGRLVEPDGTPVPDAKVMLGDARTYTDTEGYYVLPEALVRTNGVGLVSFTAPGYVDQFKRIRLEGGETHTVDIVMPAPDLRSTWQDPNTPTALSDTDVSVSIPADAVLFEGVVVQEAVDIAIVAGDPTDPIEAGMMPGSYLSMQNGGTPLESAGFFDITITGSNSGQRYSELGAPIVVEIPLPMALQAEYGVGDTIDLWSLDESTGAWVIEGQSTVFDNGGTLWTRSELTHLSWWNVDRPVEQHGCIIANVVDGAGDPIEGSLVVGKGVSYFGTSSPVTTDALGNAGVTIKNSSMGAVQVDIEARVGSLVVPHPDNPIDTPTAAGSCLRNVDCPANCDVLATPIVVDLGGTVEGTVTRRDGNPAVGFDIITTHGTVATTDSSGSYSTAVLIDHPFNVLTETYTSPELLSTTAVPVVLHDISLLNIAPKLEQFLMNGKRTYSYEYAGVTYINGSASPREPVVFETEFYDDDGDSLTYDWSDANCFDNSQSAIPWSCDPDGQGNATCTPDSTSVGWCELTLLVDDGFLASPLEFRVSLYRGEGDSYDTFWFDSPL